MTDKSQQREWFDRAWKDAWNHWHAGSTSRDDIRSFEAGYKAAMGTAPSQQAAGAVGEYYHGHIRGQLFAQGIEGEEAEELIRQISTAAPSPSSERDLALIGYMRDADQEWLTDEQILAAFNASRSGGE